MKPFLHRYGAHCCAEQFDTTEGCPKNDLFTFKGHDWVLYIGWSCGVGPKLKMRLFWITYVLTLSDFLYYVHTVLQSWFVQNKIVTGVFLENTTYVRIILHDF